MINPSQHSNPTKNENNLHNKSNKNCPVVGTHGLDGGLQNELIQARNELRDRTGKAAEKIRALTDAVSRSQDVNQREEAEAQINNVLLPAIEQLASKRELEQAKSDNDNQFIADLAKRIEPSRRLRNNGSKIQRKR